MTVNDCRSRQGDREITSSVDGFAGRTRDGAPGQRGWTGVPQRTLDELHRRYAAHGDPCDREQLALLYDGFALRLARRFGSRREQFEDLAQVARLGLLQALDRFDPARGRPFLAFARVTIQGQLKRHIRDTTWKLRVPRSLQEHFLEVVRAADDLSAELGRSPADTEVAARCRLSDEQVAEARGLGAHQWPMSLSLPGRPGPDLEPGDSDTRFSVVEDRALVSALLTSLSEHERYVVELRFGEGLAQHEIAAKLGVSQMTISRLLTRVLDRLRCLAVAAAV